MLETKLTSSRYVLAPAKLSGKIVKLHIVDFKIKLFQVPASIFHASPLLLHILTTRVAYSAAGRLRAVISGTSLSFNGFYSFTWLTQRLCVWNTFHITFIFFKNELKILVQNKALKAVASGILFRQHLLFVFRALMCVVITELPGYRKYRHFRVQVLEQQGSC